MKEVIEHFLEWHANHFDDFTPEVNAELLCLANEAVRALAPSSASD